MSTVFAGPPFIVDGPLPVPPPHRLIDVATRVPDGGDPHWRNGAEVWGYGCNRAEGIAPCLVGTDAIKEDMDASTLPDFGAFTVYRSVSCTARSIGDEQEFIDRIIRLFTAVESRAVEEQFMRGTYQPLNPFLADANASGTAVAAVSPRCGLARLEDVIAGLPGSAGLIHASPALAIALASERLIERRSDRLWTLRGTEVVVGNGYINATPDGAAAPTDEQGYLFASGPVAYYSGEVVLTPGTISEALDRTNNTVRFIAERDYLIYWDTCIQSWSLIDFCP